MLVYGYLSCKRSQNIYVFELRHDKMGLNLYNANSEGPDQLVNVIWISISMLSDRM